MEPKVMAYQRRQRYALQGKHKEKGGGEDKTVPDETYSLKELLVRFANGLPVGGREPVFASEEHDIDGVDHEKIRDADLFDREMYIEDVKRQKKSALARATRAANKAKAESQSREQDVLEPGKESPSRNPPQPYHKERQE